MRLGGSSFVISPGQGTWQLETRAGVGDGRRRRRARARGDPGARLLRRRARHPRVRRRQRPRGRPRGHRLQGDGGLVDKPLDQHGVGDRPSLPGARRLEDAGRARRAGARRQVRALVGVPPEARCRSRCPPRRVHMAAMRGMEVVRAAAAEASRCRPRSWTRRAGPRQASGGCVRETTDRGEALRRRARALREVVWGSTRCYGDKPATRRCARSSSALVRRRAVVRGRAPGLPVHALPAGAPQRGRSRTKCSTARAAS